MSTVLPSATKVLLPPDREWCERVYCEHQVVYVKRGWTQMFPITTPNKRQWYARVVLTECFPMYIYAAYARIDWIQNFGQDYRHWDKKKTFRCYISRDLSDYPVFTHQHRSEKFLQPNPAIYSVLVKEIFRELYFFLEVRYLFRKSQSFIDDVEYL